MGNMSLIILVNVLMIHSFLRSKFYNNKKIKKKSNMHVMENINESAYIGTKWDKTTEHVSDTENGEQLNESDQRIQFIVKVF